ncbi:MAG: phage tail protein [Candidatus Nanopelagicales bacterium]
MPIPVPTPSSTLTPAATSLGDAALDYLPDYVPAADDGTLAALFGALGAPVETMAGVLTDPTVTADERSTPFERLAWLAAMAGIDISTVPSDARKRAVIGNATWRYRGTLAAIRARVGETLTGAKTVEITTNYGSDPDAIAVTTFASQTPDPTATEAAIRAEIPAWMAPTIVTDAAGQSYTELASDYADYDTMTATGKTYSTLSQEI